MRKIGINMNACKGLEDEEYLRTIKGLGFEATFTGSDLADVREVVRFADLCAKHGVAYETIHSPFKRINDMWYDGEDGDRMLADLMQCVDNCAAANVEIAVVHLSSGIQAPTITDIGRARFEALVEYAAQKRVLIAFENQRKLANLSWAMETFGPDVVGFCWDCGHEQCFTPGREYMPLFGDRLICTHIHDNNGEFNNDLHILPFDGVLSAERYAAHMARSPFKGTLMLEVFASVHGGADLSPYAYLERAAEGAKRLAAIVESTCAD